MKKVQKFEILLHEDFFKKNEILSVDSSDIKVVSLPKRHYGKWYWKVLNILTFTLFFNEKFTYTVKII